MATTEKRTNRIAYLTYDGLTDPLGQSQILPYILGLEGRGFEFVIISFEKPDVFRDGKKNIDSLFEGKKIKWVPLSYHRKPPVLSTLLDLYNLWRAISSEHRKDPVHIIHCRSYITSLVGLRMKSQAGTKFIFDMRGFWADERVEGGLWNLRNPGFKLIYNFFKKKEKQFLTDADHIVSLTENAKQEILSWRLKTSPITVIPTCVDMELFDPGKIKKEDQERLRAQLGIKPIDYVLLYLGSWGTWYLTKEMLDFFSELKKQKPSAKFLIVSGDNIELTNFQKDHDVIITNSVRSSVPLYISLATASVFFIKPSYSKKASSATKMGEIMAMNVPVVTNKGWGDIEVLCQASNKSIIFEHDWLTELEMGKQNSNGRTFVAQHLSLEQGVHEFSKIYESILA